MSDARKDPFAEIARLAELLERAELTCERWRERAERAEDLAERLAPWAPADVRRSPNGR